MGKEALGSLAQEYFNTQQVAGIPWKTLAGRGGGETPFAASSDPMKHIFLVCISDGFFPKFYS